MTLQEFLPIYAGILATMLACRLLPVVFLRGRELPERVGRALGLIPVAAFSALVANDLFAPGMFDAGLVQGLIPLVAAGVVAVVAVRSKSLVASALTGIAVYGALLALVQVL